MAKWLYGNVQNTFTVVAEMRLMLNVLESNRNLPTSYIPVLH